MTNEEAIEIFKEGIKYYKHRKELHKRRSEKEKDLYMSRWYEEREEAFDLAIKALERTVAVEVKHDVLTKDDIKDVDPEDNVFADAAESLKQTISLVKEDQEKFIFEAIVPFVTEINHIIIPKRVLERALFTFKEEHTAEWKVLMKEYGGTGV